MTQLRHTVLRHIMPLAAALIVTGCASIELGTAISLTKLSPTEIDPRTGRIAILWPEAFTHYRPPFSDFKATKNGDVQIEGQFKFTTDPGAQNFVPRSPNTPGELIIYAVEESQFPMAYKAQDVLRDQKETDKFFGGPDWNVITHTDFSFTIEREAYRAYCDGTGDLDISIWVKANASKPFQRLVDDKGIDNFLSNQLKGDCKKPNTNLITPEKPASPKNKRISPFLHPTL